MNEDIFWGTVEISKAAAEDGVFADHAESLASSLRGYPPEKIIAFERIFQELSRRAYSWDLWGAAYVIHGGCSDDGFTDFRSWLISMGRKTYEAALADPESLAEIELGPDGEGDASFEEFGYVAAQVYESMTGKEIGPSGVPHPSDPSGEPFEEDSDDLARRYPRLYAKYGDG